MLRWWPVRLLLYVCDLCHQWSVRTPATNWQRNQWWCHQKQPHIKAAAPTGLPHGIMGGLGGDGQDSIIPSGPQGPVSKRRVFQSCKTCGKSLKEARKLIEAKVAFPGWNLLAPGGSARQPIDCDLFYNGSVPVVLLGHVVDAPAAWERLRWATFVVFWFNRAKTLPWLSEISASWSRSRVEKPCWISKAAKTKVLSISKDAILLVESPSQKPMDIRPIRPRAFSMALEVKTSPAWSCLKSSMMMTCLSSAMRTTSDWGLTQIPTKYWLRRAQSFSNSRERPEPHMLPARWWPRLWLCPFGGSSRSHAQRQSPSQSVGRSCRSIGEVRRPFFPNMSHLVFPVWFEDLNPSVGLGDVSFE